MKKCQIALCIMIAMGAIPCTSSAGQNLNSGMVILGGTGAVLQPQLNNEDYVAPDNDVYAVSGKDLTNNYPLSGHGPRLVADGSPDVSTAVGEINYTVNGVKKSVPYEITTSSSEQTEMSLNTLKARMSERIKLEQGNTKASFGSLNFPKRWSEETTQGEIHYVDWSDGRHYFEAKFNGNAGKNRWYYPENNKDNAWWKVVYPVEYYAITSDPQYARTINGVDLREEAKPAIYGQYAAINKLKNTYGAAFKGTIINGDITDFGHAWQWREMNRALGMLNHDYWYGLGNHDYSNNVDDCWQNRCAIRSVRELMDHIKTRKNIKSVDYTVTTGYKFPSLITNYKGSFSYSFDISGIRFIQFNNYVEYATKFSGLSFDGRRYNIDVTPSDSWLEDQMADARKQGKAIILLTHVPEMGSVGSNLYNMTSKDSRYDITAIFNGHTHSMYVSNYDLDSGATHYSQFLVAKIDNVKKEMSVYKVIYNDPQLRYPDVVIPLKLPVADWTIKEKAFNITLKNTGGYIGLYYVNYTREDGNKITVSHRLALGNTVGVGVPRGARNIKVHAETNSGRTLYDVNLNDYKNVCLKSWGTLPKNLHWGYCS